MISSETNSTTSLGYICVQLKSARQFVYPNLRKMAITIFSIPPVSAESERVFLRYKAYHCA